MLKIQLLHKNAGKFQDIRQFRSILSQQMNNGIVLALLCRNQIELFTRFKVNPNYYKNTNYKNSFQSDKISFLTYAIQISHACQIQVKMRSS